MAEHGQEDMLYDIEAQRTVENEEDKEDILNRILAKMVKEYQKYIDTQEQATELQQILCNVKQVMERLDDQENYVPVLLSYLELIMDKGCQYVARRLERLQGERGEEGDRGQEVHFNDSHEVSISNRAEEDYEKLEEMLQKYEGEVRNHIRTEQQLKMFVENLQEKVDEDNLSMEAKMV